MFQVSSLTSKSVDGILDQPTMWKDKRKVFVCIYLGTVVDDRGLDGGLCTSLLFVSKVGTFRALNLGTELSFRCEIVMVLNAPGNLEFIKLQ